jgi:polysaccharide deacetylase family protein (PEP-CTERM system associated)
VHTVATENAAYTAKTGNERLAMTCDVEDYFQVSAFDECISRSDWASIECRVPRNVDRILQMFSDHGAKGTFFVLGWFAEHFPEVVESIASEGHEIGSHGMEHIRVWQQTREEFLSDARESKKRLEDVAGVPVVGYRAASWSIDERTPWAHDVLAEIGYEYSSSVYPIDHDHYGHAAAPTVPYRVRPGGILEIPPSTAQIFGKNVAAAGGGFFRLYPLSLSRWLIERVRQSGVPYIFYFHPWEIDPDQPRVEAAPAKARFRHYLNLKQFEGRLRGLLTSYRWDRMDSIFLDRHQGEPRRALMAGADYCMK